MHRERSEMMEHLEEKQAFSPDEFARRNGLGRTFVYKEIREGRLDARKAGRRRIITRRAERAWQDSLPSANPSASSEHDEAASDVAA
jgi:excisionase family DNA binding protein